MNEDQISEVLLFSSVNESEINQVCAILNDNEIPFIRRDGGSGSYMTIYMGFSLQEKSIFVSDKDLEKAQELVSAIFENSTNAVKEEDIPELKEEKMDEAEEKEYYDKQNFLKRLIKFWYVDIGIIVIILLILQALFF